MEEYKIMQIKVQYEADEQINTKLDDLIVKGLKSVGINWYAQGVDQIIGVRDICFDVKIKEEP